MRRLLEAKTTIFDISHIFYSHFHLDHTGEFAPFIFSTKYAGGTQRKTPLTVVGGRGFLDYYNALKTAYGHWTSLPIGSRSLKIS